MTKQKKNTGCINCVHYDGGMVENSDVYVANWEYIERCNNESLTKSNKTEISPVHGEREIILKVTPQNSNQHLTCKGFTPIPPIDWKAKHDALQETGASTLALVATLETRVSQYREEELLYKGKLGASVIAIVTLAIACILIIIN